MNISKKHTLAIAYRVYPKISKVPAIFPDDKYKLTELGLRSLIKSLKNIDFKIWVIFDGCPKEYVHLFDRELANANKEYIFFDGAGNPKTFEKQVEILLNQSHSENIYFAEDDYFYLENNFEVALDFMQKHKPDFITTYNHPHNNTLKIAQIKRDNDDYLNLNGWTWKTQASTTMTFMTTKQKLLETKEVFMTYTRKNFDNAMWFSLTNYKLLNIIDFIYNLFTNKSIAYIYLKAYYFVLIPLIFGKKYKLWVIENSLSTHLDLPTIAPEVNWNKEFEKIINELKF